MALFKVLIQHLPGRSEENHKTQIGAAGFQPVSQIWHKLEDNINTGISKNWCEVVAGM
jgi:hypothetical protein